jgi:hypothetical protein
MSLQKMISDVETERAHNRVMGDSLADQLRNMKLRHCEEIDALIAALQIEIEARDQALYAMVNGNA